jgi:hypothetical protein
VPTVSIRTIQYRFRSCRVPASEWLKIFAAGSEGGRRTIAVSARLAEYKNVRDELDALITKGDDVGEGRLQNLLKDNPWLFGSEYSELLSRRNWTRDQKLDFMLRRTADDYLEIIEIKTPSAQPLFGMTCRRSSRISCRSSGSVRSAPSRLTTTVGAAPSHPRAVERGTPRRWSAPQCVGQDPGADGHSVAAGGTWPSCG